MKFVSCLKFKRKYLRVVDIFYKWGEDGYKRAYIRLARNEMRNALSEFDSIEIYYNRVDVESKMNTYLSAAIDELHATLDNFQLLDIILPDAFSTSVENIEDIRLQSTTADFQKDEAEQEAEGLFLIIEL
jgi:hypothetical protein